MKRSRIFLGVAIALFTAWMGYLSWLAATHGHWKEDETERVLSRSQFLVSQLDILADLASLDDKEITIKEVFANLTDQDLKPGDEVRIENLSASDGWKGPGRYILPLVRLDGKEPRYKVADLPRTPGFITNPPPPPRIYRETPETRQQLGHIAKAVKE